MLLYTAFLNSAFAFLIVLALCLAGSKPAAQSALPNFTFYVFFTPIIPTVMTKAMQRSITSVRAMLKNACHIDAEHETQMQSTISRLIAQKNGDYPRASMRAVQNADKIAMLFDGAVAEMGAPEEPIKKDGIFFRMITLQRASQNRVISFLKLNLGISRQTKNTR